MRRKSIYVDVLTTKELEEAIKNFNKMYPVENYDIELKRVNWFTKSEEGEWYLEIWKLPKK